MTLICMSQKPPVYGVHLKRQYTHGVTVEQRRLDVFPRRWRSDPPTRVDSLVIPWVL
jgi:hypothetical protein